MANLILLTGGSRSGKSGYAQRLAESLPPPRLFVATCPVLDLEMAERIRRHRRDRAGRQWETIEETIEIAPLINAGIGFNVVLVDCLTLWVGNLMWQAEQAGRKIDENEVAMICQSLLAACREYSGTVIMVTNEVGCGVVPESAAGRQFRDLAGRANQLIAAAANQVVLMVCGIATVIKEKHDGIT